MRSIRRTAVAIAASGLLAAGTFTALTVMAGPANAGVAGSCTGAGTPISCTITGLAVASPTTIEVNATSSPSNLTVDVKWSVDCTLGGQDQTKSGGAVANTPAWTTLVLGFTNPDSCAVTATATLSGSSSTAAKPPSLTLNIDYNPQPGSGSSPSPSSSPSSTPTGITGLISGLGGKCVDDAGNSSALRAKVQIWTCKSSDKSQPWKYASGELMHNGLCLNAKGNAVSRSKIILWTCSRSANETWVYQLNHTYELKAHNWTLCLDDPGNSTRNGTQLIVYTCHNSSNQHWSLP